MLRKVHLAYYAIDVLNCFFNGSLSTSAHQRNAHCAAALAGQLGSGSVQVEAHGVWQDNAVSYTMGHPGSTAQHMAKPMMKSHRNVGEGGPGKK